LQIAFADRSCDLASIAVLVKWDALNCARHRDGGRAFLLLGAGVNRRTIKRKFCRKTAGRVACRFLVFLLF